MARTKHIDHSDPQRWCRACRWEAMDPETQASYREDCRQKAKAQWERNHPDRASIRRRLEATAIPDLCDRCSRPDDLVPMIDYDAERITGWRCRPHWRSARAEWSARHSKAA
jgi:hypothetical protein